MLFTYLTVYKRIIGQNVGTLKNLTITGRQNVDVFFFDSMGLIVKTSNCNYKWSKHHYYYVD